MVRFLLLRPMLAGLVIDPAIADMLAEDATRGFGGRARPVRDDAVHRGEPVTTAHANLALACLVALSQEVLGQLVQRLGMKWPAGPWLLRGGVAEDPLAR